MTTVPYPLFQLHDKRQLRAKPDQSEHFALRRLKTEFCSLPDGYRHVPRPNWPLKTGSDAFLPEDDVLPTSLQKVINPKPL